MSAAQPPPGTHLSASRLGRATTAVRSGRSPTERIDGRAANAWRRWLCLAVSLDSTFPGARPSSPWARATGDNAFFCRRRKNHPVRRSGGSAASGNWVMTSGEASLSAVRSRQSRRSDLRCLYPSSFILSPFTRPLLLAFGRPNKMFTLTKVSHFLHSRRAH